MELLCSCIAGRKELRSCAEENELEERNEWIAYSAQMVAMTKDHAETGVLLKDKNETLERQWRERFESQRELCNQKEIDLIHVKEIVTGLDAEKKKLIDALNDMKRDTVGIEEIGILNGEINMLKERLKAAELKVIEVSTASAE